VSVVTTNTAAAGSAPADPVRALQHALYRAAKADPGRRFHALRDKVFRKDVLWRAWVAVFRNDGAPGIDKATLADVKEYGVARLLDELAVELREGGYRPLPARRVLIPKPGTAERRPLSIPTVRDRIVQAAVKIVLEPVFEADFLPCSFGFRPRRSPHDALQAVIDEAWRGRRWVVETDIAECFTAIPHDKLMQAIEERVCDQGVLRLVRAILRAGVMEDGNVRRPVTGAAQGGVVSPLLCNVFLHRIDRAWSVREHGVMVRFADDMVVMCRSREQAEAALQRLRDLLADLGLQPKEAKTRIVCLEVDGEGFDFLGFHHRMVRSRSRDGRRPVIFLAAGPRIERCSMPATESVNSRASAGYFCLLRRWCRTSTCSCAAGWGTSSTGTRRNGSARSGTTCGCGSRCSSVNGTAVADTSGCGRCSTTLRTSTA